MSKANDLGGFAPTDKPELDLPADKPQEVLNTNEDRTGKLGRVAKRLGIAALLSAAVTYPVGQALQRELDATAKPDTPTLKLAKPREEVATVVRDDETLSGVAARIRNDSWQEASPIKSIHVSSDEIAPFLHAVSNPANGVKQPPLNEAGSNLQTGAIVLGDVPMNYEQPK